MISTTLRKQNGTCLAAWVFVTAAAALATLAPAFAAGSAVGDPEIKTDHPYYQGELAYSNLSNLVASALATTGRPTTGDPVKDQIIKLWYWRIEHYYHQWSPQEYNLPGVVPNPPNDNPLMIDRDCLSQQFSFGYGVCGTNHSMCRPIFETAGFKSRCRSINGDTTHEVYYGTRWAMINADSASIISMTNNAAAEFAGVDDLIGNINLLLNYPLAIPQYPFGNQQGGAEGTHSGDWYGYYTGGFTGLTPATSAPLDGYGYQARPIAYVLKRGETFTRFADRDGLPNYLGAPGVYRWWGFVGSGGPFRDWSYVGLAPAQQPPASTALANTRFGNGIFEWTPTLPAGDTDDAVVAKDAAIVYSATSPHLAASSGTAQITLAFFSPYCLTGIPSDGSDPAQSGATGGAWIVPTAVGSVPFEISTNNGASWTSAGTLSGTTPLDFTDLVKGHHAYLMRFTVSTSAGLDAFTLKNCVQVAVAVFPTLNAGGSLVTYNAGNKGVVEQNPDFSSLANANVFKVADSGANVSFSALPNGNDMAYSSNNNQPIWVSYRISAPPGTTLKQIDAAADIQSRVPPAGGYAQLAVSTDGGTSFTTFSNQSPDSDNQGSDFWGYGSVDISSAGVNQAIVKVISYNGGYTAGIRYVRLYGEYATPSPGALSITHVWDDSGGTGKTCTQNLAAGTTSTTYSVPTANSPVSRSVAFSVAASSNPPVLTTITVTPTPATVAAGASMQFTAVALDQFGVALASQPAMTWGATGGAVNASGLFTAGSSAGPATVTATSGTINGSATVTVLFPLTVTVDGKSKVYGAAVPALTFTYTGLENGDTSASFTGALATAATAGSGVGTYPITQGTLAASGNYMIGTFNSANLTVAQAPLTVTVAAKSKVYGAANPPLTYTYNGLVNGDTSAAFTGALATSATTGSGVGTYPISQNTLAGAGNYTLSTFNGANLTVTAAPLTVTADAQSKVYGAALPALTCTITGYRNGENASSANVTGTPTLSTTAAAGSAVAGSPYTIACGAGTLAAPNYTFTPANGQLTVTPAALTVTADAKSKVYGPTNPPFTYTYNGLVNGDTSATFTGCLAASTAAGSGVGTYSITQNTLAAAGNYAIGTFNGANLTVTAAPLTLSADAKSKVYGAANPALTYTCTGLVNGDTAAKFTGVLATSATTGSGVGAYPITQGTLAATGNYSVNYVAATLTITKATATVTLTNPPQTYDGTPKNVVASTTPAGLSLVFTFNGSPAAPTNAGNYNVVATVNDPNYQGSAVGLLSIAPAAATVTLGSLTQTYDGTPKSATATTAPAGLQVTFTYDGSATPPTNVGSYAVVGTISDSNSSGSASASGTLTIVAPVPVAVPTFSPAAGGYAGAQSVTISCATSGATIYYTLDGSAPTASSPQYAAAINVSAPTTIKAYAVQTGMTDSAVASAAYTVLLPNSSGAGQSTPNTGATASNPVDGTSVTVSATDGGVVVLQAGQNGGALPAGYAISTTFYDADGNVLATDQGAQPAYGFTDAGLYLAVVTVTDTQGNASTTDLALPISAAETGTAQGTTPPSSMAISGVVLKGKLLFSASKADTVSFKGTLELPAGLDLSAAQTLAVSLGNVVDTAKLNAKGTVKAGVKKLLKSVAVKYPKLRKVNKKAVTITTVGLMATVSFTLSAYQLDKLGFGAEGISKAGGTAGQSVPRTITAALLLGGTAYRQDIPVNWKLSKKGDNGQLTTSGH
ncbi:MAG: MBG domain-containing protein [Planctomycetota bacterium]